MATTKNIGTMDLERSWPYGDNSWKPGMDRNLQKLSIMTMATVMSRTTEVPETGSPGDVYIDPATSLIVFWERDSDVEGEPYKWLAIEPVEPSLIWVKDDENFVKWDDAASSWSVMFDPSSAVPTPATRAVATFIPGEVVPAATVFMLAVRVSFDLAADFAGSQGYAEVAPSGGDVSFKLRKNGVDVGLITFGNGMQAPTFAAASPVSLVEGDILAIASPSNLFGLSTVAITLKGTTPGL